MSSEYKYDSLLLVPIYLLLFLFSSKHCCAIDSITHSQQLSKGQTLSSPGQAFVLGFFSPNNSTNHRYIGIWNNEKPTRTVAWVANRENPLGITNSTESLRIAGDGNLELVDGNGTPLWSTNIQIGSNNSVVTLSDRGNLELKDGGSGQTLWDSFSHPGDTFLPSSFLGFNTKTGEKYNLTSWKSDNDPSVGSFTTEVSPSLKPAQVVVWNGSKPHWRSGPWSRLKFTGLPDMASSFQSPFDLIVDEDKGTTLFSFSFNPDVGTVMRLSPEGKLILMLKENGSDWYTDWEAPKTACDAYGLCGPSSLCIDSESHTCSCLKGFMPKSQLEWSQKNWTHGCQRRKELDCEKNANTSTSGQRSSDVFIKFPNVKLPDLYEYVSVPPDSEACQTWCLRNCSCRACAFVVGIGCLTWSEGLVDIRQFSVDGGEELLLRLVKGETDGGGTKKRKIIIISLATISSGAILLMLLFMLLLRLRAKRRRYVEVKSEKNNSTSTSGNLRPTLAPHNSSELPIFDFKTIEIATGDFSLKNKLGQGGFGPVYKGLLQDGTEIAVKRLASSSGQGVDEFKNEMILISKLQHRNLVRLLGYCIDKEEKLLIYEFMPNKSLDSFIFDPKRKAELKWTTRFNIVNGIARGLVYLHRDSFLRVIHRDLKVSNILLDEKMNPKISDFGLARIFEGTVDLANTNRVVGTLGYMSPEYAMGGIFSEKSDVFSFGVLMLEIVSGRKNTSFRYYEENLSLIAHAWHLWSEDRVQEMVDVVLEGSYSPAEVHRYIQVGLLCVQDHASDRPSMPDIISMLSSDKDCPEPKEPLFTFQRPSELLQQSDNNSSGNKATMSILEGR